MFGGAFIEWCFPDNQAFFKSFIGEFFISQNYNEIGPKKPLPAKLITSLIDESHKRSIALINKSDIFFQMFSGLFNRVASPDPLNLFHRSSEFINIDIETWKKTGGVCC